MTGAEGTDAGTWQSIMAVLPRTTDTVLSDELPLNSAISTPAPAATHTSDMPV